MGPEQHIEEQKPILEEAIGSNFNKLQEHRNQGKLVSAHKAEQDMNKALEDYYDLMKAIAHVANLR